MCLYSVHPYVISPFEQLGATRREVFVYRFRSLFLQKGHRFGGVLGALLFRSSNRWRVLQDMQLPMPLFQ